MKEIRSSKKNRRWQLFFLTLLYGFAYLNFVNRKLLSSNMIITLRYSIMIMCSLYFVFSYLKRYSSKRGNIPIPRIKNNAGLFFLWMLFSLFVVISQMINGSIPFEGLAYLLITTSIFFVVIPLSLEKSIEIILKAAFLSSTIYLILSVVYCPIVLGKSYYGITYNPNSIGQLSAQAAISSFCLFLNALNHRHKRDLVLYFIFFIFSLLFVIVSNSRTSLLAVIITVLLTILLFLVLHKIKIRKFLMPSIIFLVLYFLKIKKYLEAGILNKMFKYQDNPLTGRTAIWGSVFDELTIFGHGKGYFSGHIEKGAHNSVVEIVGTYGIITGIIILSLFIVSVIVSFKYLFRNRKNKYSYAPFAIIITFVTLSIAEGMFGVIGKGITIMYFNVLGIMLF